MLPHRLRLLNYGHRGAPCAAPENTLAAFQVARELGVDGVELDVRLSRDGEVVVRHDDFLERTTDGHGQVRERTLSELQCLDAGAWFGPQYAGERIPTLRQVLRWSGGEVLLNIELKTQSLRDFALERKVVALVAEHRLESRVIVSSFNPLALRQVKHLNPGLHTGLLYAPGLPLYLRRAWLRPLARPDTLHPQFRMVDGGYLHWARSSGYGVHVWAPADPKDLRHLIALEVDAIITDRPDLLVEELHQQQ